MTTSTLTLTDFLLARIAKDEDDIRSAVEMHEAWPYGNSKRFLVECTTKRRLLGLLDEVTEQGIPCLTIYTRDRIPRLLALPYADHPDYREEWKP